MANGQPFAVVSDPIRRQNVAFSEFPALCLESGRVEDRGTVAYVVRVADGQPSAAVAAATFVHFLVQTVASCLQMFYQFG